jgi:hypothetical protein
MTTKCRFVNAGFSLTYDGSTPLFQGDLRLISFNVNLGIGDGSSTLDLELAVDDCLGVGAVVAPGVGRTAYFRSLTTDFEFNGIINSATYTDSPSGRIYKYKINDPKKLLDNVYVLLKDYYCSTGLTSIPNFISVINIIEGGSAVCPPGFDTENWPRVAGNCPGYGNSGIFGSSSQNGISIAKALAVITSRQGIFAVRTTANDVVRLDLSRLAARVNAYAPWSKTDSTGMSLGALVEQAAQDSACDYIVTLERGGFVTVWPIERELLIAGNPIASIIAAYRQSGTLLSSELGEVELYEPTNKVLLGDKVSYISEVDCRNGTASMMLGYDPDGKPIRAKGTNFTATINTTSLQAIIPEFPAMTRISEREILCAKTQEMWMVYGNCIDKNSLSGQLLNILGLQDFLNQAKILEAFNGLVGARVDDTDTIKGWQEKLNALKGINQVAAVGGPNANKISFLRYVECWKWFNSFIETYYGKKWLVPIKNFCIFPGNSPSVIIGDGGPYQISDVPTDAGYPSPGQFNRGILQLSGQNALLFEGADGKYNGFIRVNGKKQFTRKLTKDNVTFQVSVDQMNAGNFVVQGNEIYVKTTLEGEIHGNFGKPEVLISTDIIPMTPKVDAVGPVNRGLQAMAALFGADKFINRGNNSGYSNISSLNLFQLNFLAADLDFAAVPMKSNMYVYGPWVSTKNPFLTGSTEVVVDTQLNPWNYGSYSAMSTAGAALADIGVRLYNKEFTGSFRVAEPPGLSVREFVTNYRILISNINVIYGSNGVTTDVSFKTFVPKFGQYGQAFSDLMLENNKARSQTLSYFKDLRRKSMSEMYTMYTNLNKELTKIPKFNDVADGKTPYFILIGGGRGHKDNSGGSGGSSFSPVSPKGALTCKEICEQPPPQNPPGSNNGGNSIAKIIDVELEKENIAELSHTDTQYKFRSFMSLDGLFAPVSTNGRNNYISKYYSSYDSGAKINKPRPPMPPVGSEILPINQRFLNPIISKQILSGEWDGRGVSQDGFYVKYIAFGEDIKTIRDHELRQKETDFGFFALKGPLVLQAWGYDTEGKPIPNIVDSPADAENGIFKNDGTKNKFMTNWLENQKTWPVGPVDLRFDRSRGVWVSPQQERIIVAQLLGDLSPGGSAEAMLLNPGGSFYENYAIYGPNGENLGSNIGDVRITVHDFLSRKLCKGTRVYAYYNDNKYIVIESSAFTEESCECTECESTSESESSTCDDCGLGYCIPGGIKEGVLGFDKEGCLTIYELTQCEESSEEECGTCRWQWSGNAWYVPENQNLCSSNCLCIGAPDTAGLNEADNRTGQCIKA